MNVITNDETLKAMKSIIDGNEDQPSSVRLYVAGFG